ncbi:MAG: PASTA domain-containing protein, partial [Candidatus Hydrogenedentes bacterium]|nr:PASTA domain-containing protein [Candidatus Hydrogenedentota bacterium]
MKRGLSLLVGVTSLILVVMVSGCAPKIGVDPKSIDFGDNQTEAKIKVWNDRALTLFRLNFKVDSVDDWVVGILPYEEVSKNRKDKKEIKVIVAREGLAPGKHKGKIVVSRIDEKTGKKVEPVDIPTSIIALADDPNELIMPPMEGLLSSLGLDINNKEQILANIALIEKALLEVYGFRVSVQVIEKCSGQPEGSYLGQEPPVGAPIQQGAVVYLYYSSGVSCPEGVVEGEGVPEGVVEGTPEGVVEGT